ncbi:MAG TPA: hypothetical protein VKC66_18405 [Xanthobacteraceae bacterium]|nr:hypothetical protein [Xanthobacteraceae bacterium]
MRIFSTDSAKAAKAGAHGYLDAIMYLAPAKMANGKFNLCSHASPACIALCLGWFSGQAGIVKDLEHDTNATRASRRARAIMFMEDRAAFLLLVVREIDGLERAAARLGFKLCVRMNGSSDVAWEGIRFTIERDQLGRAIAVKLGGPDARNVFDHYPHLPFVDYTKNPGRFLRALPSNYHLTFSRSEINEDKALELLERGVNVSVIFAGEKPGTWHGYTVIDGDTHDLRHLDPRAALGEHGYVIALSPKGRKTKADVSGFVIRQAA